MVVDGQSPRLGIAAWRAFAKRCFAAVNAPVGIAEKIRTVLIDAEALGYSSND